MRIGLVVLACVVAGASLLGVGRLTRAAQSSGVGEAKAASAGVKPNLVLFLADDLTWFDSAPFDGKEGKPATPSMERVMKAGMRFDSAFVASPSCAPSRAALLTSMYPYRTGAMYNSVAPRKDAKKWPAYLKEQGYEVVAIGKVAHYGQVQQYGFDYCADFGYHKDICIDDAVKWLRDRKAKGGDQKPLCICVGTNWPHVPWPRENLADPATVTIGGIRMVDTPETRVSMTRYHAGVENADRDLGKIYDAAKETLGENTLFAFSSDHGAQWPGGKWNLYDQGVKVPLYVVWPGNVAAGSVSHAMVSWVDVLPTFIEAAGGTAPPMGTQEGEISGRSFLDVLEGKSQTARDRIFLTHSGDPQMNQYPQRAVRTAQFKYLRNLDPEAEYHSHVDLGPPGPSGGYFRSWVAKAKTDEGAAKVVHAYYKRPGEELYDIVADPGEEKNLAGDPKYAETMAELSGELDRWMASLGDEGLKTERVLQAKHGRGAPDVESGGTEEGPERPARRRRQGANRAAATQLAATQPAATQPAPTQPGEEGK